MRGGGELCMCVYMCVLCCMCVCVWSMHLSVSMGGWEREDGRGSMSEKGNWMREGGGIIL